MDLAVHHTRNGHTARLRCARGGGLGLGGGCGRRVGLRNRRSGSAATTRGRSSGRRCRGRSRVHAGRVRGLLHLGGRHVGARTRIGVPTTTDRGVATGVGVLGRVLRRHRGRGTRRSVRRGRHRGRRVVGRHIGQAGLAGEDRVATTNHDVDDRTVAKRHLDGRAVTGDACRGRDTVGAVAHARVEGVGGCLCHLERGALGVERTLVLVEQPLPLRREAVAVDQTLPVVRVVVQPERVGPDSQAVRVRGRLLEQDLALRVGDAGCLGLGRGERLLELGVDLVLLVGSRSLCERRLTGRSVLGRVRCGRRRCRRRRLRLRHRIAGRYRPQDQGERHQEQRTQNSDTREGASYLRPDGRLRSHADTSSGVGGLGHDGRLRDDGRVLVTQATDDEQRDADDEPDDGDEHQDIGPHVLDERRVPQCRPDDPPDERADDDDRHRDERVVRPVVVVAAHGLLDPLDPTHAGGLVRLGQDGGVVRGGHGTSPIHIRSLLGRSARLRISYAYSAAASLESG